jgi:hypothetical protein
LFNGFGGSGILNGFVRISAYTTKRTKPMTKMKTLGAVIILTAAVAAPVFAQDAGKLGRGSNHGQAYDQSNYRGAYNQLNGAPFDAAPQTPEEMRNRDNFGFSGRDPSRVGGEAPNLNPAGT